MDVDILDDKIYILLSVNLFFFAQLKDLNIKNIANFNIMKLSVLFKLDINKPQSYVK